MKINIYVANLTKYNEGILKGEWIKLPISKEELEEALNEILGSDDEHAIHDFEAPFDIHEYDNIYELNEFAQELVGVDEDEKVIKIISSDILGSGYYRSELVRILKDHEYSVVSDVWSEQDLALKVDDELLPFDYSLIKDSGIDNYLDWEKIGREMVLDGWIIKNGIAIKVEI